MQAHSLEKFWKTARALFPVVARRTWMMIEPLERCCFQKKLDLTALPLARVVFVFITLAPSIDLHHGGMDGRSTVPPHAFLQGDPLKLEFPACYYFPTKVGNRARVYFGMSLVSATAGRMDVRLRTHSPHTRLWRRVGRTFSKGFELLL